ncbi:MAG: hypothetical protein HeimC2_32540 [Candidatus Heimdallarchaeota archaeon LC_2]|nr:MAG: hypothetical protein HeimC2_32540 [Candidatus Heimdallarchaeota archaeon LC_2]
MEYKNLVYLRVHGVSDPQIDDFKIKLAKIEVGIRLKYLTTADFIEDWFNVIVWDYQNYEYEKYGLSFAP